MEISKSDRASERGVSGMPDTGLDAGPPGLRRLNDDERGGIGSALSLNLLLEAEEGSEASLVAEGEISMQWAVGDASK